MTGTKILLSASLSLQKHSQQHLVTVDQKYYNNSVQHSLHRHIHLPNSGISACYESWRVGVRLPGSFLLFLSPSPRRKFLLPSPQSTYTPDDRSSSSPSPFFPFLWHLLLGWLLFLTHRVHFLSDATFLGTSSAKASSSPLGPFQTDGDNFLYQFAAKRPWLTGTPGWNYKIADLVQVLTASGHILFLWSLVN